MSQIIKIYPSSQNKDVENELFSIKDSGMSIAITVEEFNEIQKQDIASLNVDSDTLTLKDPDAFWDGILDGFKGVDYDYLDRP